MNEILHVVDFFLYDVIFPVLHYFCVMLQNGFFLSLLCVKMNQLKVLILKVFSFVSDKFIYHIWSQQGKG